VSENILISDRERAEGFHSMKLRWQFQSPLRLLSTQIQ